MLDNLTADEKRELLDMIFGRKSNIENQFHNTNNESDDDNEDESDNF